MKKQILKLPLIILCTLFLFDIDCNSQDLPETTLKSEFRIQLGTWSVSGYDSADKFAKISRNSLNINAYIIFKDNWYKVLVGDFVSRDLAKEKLTQIRNKYSKAWVVPADNDKIKHFYQYRKSIEKAPNASLNIPTKKYMPTSTTNQVIHHSYYSLSYSEQHEQAEWVAYQLTSSMTNGSVSRTDNFRPDPLVSTHSAQLADYKGSGYDRGHLAPAGDMTFSSIAMSESFYMSNMSPQYPSFNRGIWKKLEGLVRSWAINNNEVYIVTGGILSSNKGILGNGVSIPNNYYKIVFDYKEPEVKAIGLIIPNDRGTKDLKEYVVTIDYIEGLTGIDFFSELPDELEDKLESSKDASLWSWNTSTIPRTSTSTASSNKKSATQCLGIAKSTSKRCKNKTTNVNGYCYLHQNQAPDYVKPKSTGGSPDGRCMAITKAGTRCKRKAQAGSKYCWQHQR